MTRTVFADVQVFDGSDAHQVAAAVAVNARLGDGARPRVRLAGGQWLLHAGRLLCAFAARLSVSRHTLPGHVESILGKVGAGIRSRLVALGSGMEGVLPWRADGVSSWG